MDPLVIERAARALGTALAHRGWSLVTAESCTAGGLSAAITAIPGSSAWFDRGFITYSNAAKREMLGVDARVLDAEGAVSEACARAMVDGALARSPATVAVAITGIAGPGGGSGEKPVGTVWFAWAVRDAVVQTQQRRFTGDRMAVRAQSVAHALAGLIALVQPAG